MEPETPQSASGGPTTTPQPEMSARVKSIMQDFLSLSAEEKDEFRRLILNSPSDADPWPPPPPASGLPASACTPVTAAVPSTSTDPTLPPTPSAIPAPHPQTPAPLHAAPETDASSIPQPSLSSHEERFLQEFHSFSEEQRRKILCLLNSPSDAGPSSAPPPAAGLPASASTPETDAGLSATDPALPTTSSAIPAPPPQKPAPLHAAPECDASSIPLEGEQMSLPSLEKLLRVTEEDVTNGAVVPAAGWKGMEVEKTKDGFTLLMRAAREGALDCVEFLLRCGTDVNARTKQWCGAVDYAFKGDHSKVALLLFRWDSRLPKRRSYEREMFQALLEQDDEVKKLFEERDLFSDELMKENLGIVEEMIDTFNGLRYCVNSEGHSALYTAGYDFKFRAWALLKSRGFQYLAEERSEMEDFENDEENKLLLDQALENYFVDIDECHVLKMFLKSKVRCGQSHMRDRIRGIYEEMDQVPMASLLLQCLQDDCYLEVVLDMERSDISCICAGASEGVLGVMDPNLHRVYASGGETEEFDHSDVISNMVHELAHRAMLIVFENEGLPFKEEDAKGKEEYEEIVSKVMSKERLKDCDEIIKRVTAYDQSQHGMELIVRVPEIISKYRVNKDVYDGYSRLQAQAEELYEFYEKHVEPEIKSYIKKNSLRNKMPLCDMSTSPGLLCKHFDERVKVKNDMEKAVISKENGFQILGVYNAKLGISHLRKSFDDIFFIDYTMLSKFKEYINIILNRKGSTKVVVLLEAQQAKEVISNPGNGGSEYWVTNYKDNPNFMLLVFHEKFTEGHGTVVSYGWSDLSDDTKKWVLEKKVIFQGRQLLNDKGQMKVTLEQVLKDVLKDGNIEKLKKVSLKQFLKGVLKDGEGKEWTKLSLEQFLSGVLKDGNVQGWIKEYLEQFLTEVLKDANVEGWMKVSLEQSLTSVLKDGDAEGWIKVSLEQFLTGVLKNENVEEWVKLSLRQFLKVDMKVGNVEEWMNISIEQFLKGVLKDGNVEEWMQTNLTPRLPSVLTDKEMVWIGGELKMGESELEKRGKELLRGHPGCHIERRTRVRPLQFNKEIFEWRTNDVFFIQGAEERDVKTDWISKVSKWEADRIPDDTRCFLLGKGKNKRRKNVFKSISKKLKNECSPGKHGQPWHFAHFFKHREKRIDHFESIVVNRNRSMLVADDPGNGKSVYLNMKAQEGKKSTPATWVRVVELCLHEEELEKRKGVNFASKEECEKLLFDLVCSGEMKKSNRDELKFQKEVFRLYCQQSGKVSIYLDGVDEVCPDHSDTVNSFLEKVMVNTEIDLTVSTRIHEREKLETSLSTIAHRLDPFDKDDQIEFLNAVWNEKLKFHEDHGNKIKSITETLESMSEKDNEITSLIDNLNLSLKEDSKALEFNFSGLAKYLIMKVGDSSERGEKNVMATPLYAWIAASVAFENNFKISGSLNLNNIYENLINGKIDVVFIAEKVKFPESCFGKVMKKLFKSKLHDQMKEFAASYFLNGEKHNSDEDTNEILIQVGLIAKVGDTNVFVHRTFGEYMLSLWLLDGKAEVEAMMKVLSEKEFRQVRRFLEGQLSSFKKLGSSKSGEGVGEKRISLMNPTKFPSKVEDAVISFKKCLYLSIAEGNVGIFRHLIETSDESVECVVYEKAEFDIRELNLSVDDSCETVAWNAFTVFGEIILGNVTIADEGTTTTFRIQSLRLLVNFLNWIKGKDNFIGRLGEVLTDQKLAWMGFGVEDLWVEEEGRKQFELLLEFLIGVNSVLGESVKKALMAKESESLFEYAAKYSIKSFVPLLDAYLKKSDFDDSFLGFYHNTSLIKCNNVVCAWTTVAKRSGVEGLQLFWDCLRSKMETPERMKRFLRRKDGKKRNALLASFCNEKYPNVSANVRKLYCEVFHGSELKDHLFNTFSGVESKDCKFNKFAFYDWIIGLLSIGFLNEGEVARLFLSKNESGKYYLLDLDSRHNIPSPSLFSKVQHLIFERLPSKEEIVRNMKGHYYTMTRSCFDDSSWMGVDVDFECEVESAFEAMRPSILSFPLFRDFRLDGEGNLVGVVDYYTEERVNVIQFKAFGVLLRRQVEMEQGMLGREEAVKRLKGEWRRMFLSFPRLFIEGREGKEWRTIELSVRFTFAVLSVILKKEEIEGILLESDYYNPLHYALDWSDPMAFLALYDIGRWCMAEDALWRLHAVEWREGGTLLELLLRRQREGDFAHIEEVLPY